MEIRDPYATNPHVDSDSLNGWLRRRLEPFFVRHADQIVWDDGIQLPDDYFEKTYPKIPSDKWTKLPHLGFENKKFEGADEQCFDSFTITYAGSFYEGWIEPYSVLKGLAEFDKQFPDADIELRFYGDWNSKYDEAAKEAGVSDLISTFDWIEYEDLIPILKGSDAVLYIGGTDPSNKLNIPSKMYDYVGSSTPILAVVDNSFRAAKFVADNELGIVVSPSDAHEIALALKSLYENDISYDETITNRFSRSKKMDELTEILDGMV
ncbi:glycosyltransferase [Haloarcula salinisoli]|uniref:Glycosyl transferases group 1 n=1 Tax=Haloarcula salinisoli TaxID=2487746 RepID=A0A8J8CA03_9EURY|nr:hypothetical protein [Halomicroarcula salinisoli]MBX0287826.1 hypothetical protein [Halomicroarcula salinisoli]MBX0304769.1 hypothetical protein [Halomicroarcula salinisoli]